MEKERKIKPVVRKFSSFEEAEEADDNYWANTSEEERLNALIDLRNMFSDDVEEVRIQKVVIKRSIYEEDD
jgi:hypothetical protein